MAKKGSEKQAKGGSGIFVLASVVVCALALVVALFQSGVVRPTKIFDEEVLREIAEATQDLPRDQKFANITAELKNRYPGHIYDHPWTFINCGGFMGSYKLLHASLSEYVLFFGVAVSTSGHSGRYWGDIYDWLLTGHMKQWLESEVDYEFHQPPNRVDHPAWTASAVYWPDDTWMLEYSHGVIPSYSIFALADSVFSTLDVITVFKSLTQYGGTVAQELMQGKI